jgi:hypothetical protein
MYEVYKELEKLLKKEKITVIDFCNNILKKSKASLFRLFKEKRIRTDLNEDELGILETILSWILRQNVTSVVEFEESTKRNRPNASHKNGFLKENFSDELNIQNVRLNMDKLKRKLKEKHILVEDFTKSVLKSNHSSFNRLCNKQSFNQLTKK